MFEHMMTYQEVVDSQKTAAHPAAPVAYFLGSTNMENNSTRLKQLELWFREYQIKRGQAAGMFKSAKDMVTTSGSLVELTWI